MVDKNIIKQSIISMQDQLSKLVDADVSKDMFAELLSTILVDAIRSADVISVNSIITGVAGSIPVSGTATQTGTGKLQ